MKLKTHRVERHGDRTVIHGTWTDELRRPARVRVEIVRGEEPQDSLPLIADGDVKDVGGALFGLADIAWGLGWRPRGLIGRLAHMVESYKLPPPEK